MVEDDTKNIMIQSLKTQLVNEPSVNKTQHAAFQNDNIQVKLNQSQKKAKIIKRGQASVNVDLKFALTKE